MQTLLKYYFIVYLPIPTFARVKNYTIVIFFKKPYYNRYTNDMPTYWINSYQMGHLWFEGWIVEEKLMYAGVLVFLFCCCIFSQFLFWFLTKKFDFMKQKSTEDETTDYSSLDAYVFTYLLIYYNLYVNFVVVFV